MDYIEGLKNKEKIVTTRLDDIKCNKNLLFENFIWLTTNEAAEYLRTSPKQIRNWVYQGKVRAYKLFSKSLRFKKSELDFLLEGGPKWE